MPKHAPNVPKGTPSDRSDERIGLTAVSYTHLTLPTNSRV